MSETTSVGALKGVVRADDIKQEILRFKESAMKAIQALMAEVERLEERLQEMELEPD